MKVAEFEVDVEHNGRETTVTVTIKEVLSDGYFGEYTTHTATGTGSVGELVAEIVEANLG